MPPPLSELSSQHSAPSTQHFPFLLVRDLGILPYETAWSLQKEMVAARHAEPDLTDALLLCEHPAVVTLGRRGGPASFRTAPQELEKLGIGVFRVERGGEATVHAPGQLVGYPILRLKRLGLGIHDAVRALEDVLLRTLADFGLTGQRRPRTAGIWVNDEKIASLGIAVRRGVTFHGFALNVTTDLSYFNHIIPCGMPDARLTSMEKRLGTAPDAADVRRRVIEHFRAVFGYDAAPAESGDSPSINLNSSFHASRTTNHASRLRFPPWLRKRLAPAGRSVAVGALLDALHLHTVCREARCPNQQECFSRGTSTFLILGPDCTRACRFCAVGHGAPRPPDPDEPARVAEAVRTMDLRHAVVTSVTRDDLSDGGAAHYAATIRAIREAAPSARVEVLTPDFEGCRESIETVVRAAPDVYNHNVETVPRLYGAVRPRAVYARSLSVLRTAAAIAPGRLTKSGLMLGLGETTDEVLAVMRDLRGTGCGMLTLGQYLRPAPGNLPVERFVPPEEFDALRKEGLAMGFRLVAAAPFVRSSYEAERAFQAAVDGGPGSETIGGERS
ncbi:MAG: lipoyl synthase [Planctomycetota bacterium]